MDINDLESKAHLPEVEKIKVYKTRWVVLGIFVLYSACNAVQWIQFSIITNVIVDYYHTTNTWVDWTSMVYMVLYIPFIFPASYLLEKLGLRKSVIIGITGTAIGSWIKVGAVHPDRFLISFAGQTIVAFSQIFILSVPARLAAVWFGPSQVSSACSIGVFGNQLGIAVGFLVPPLVVPGGTTEEVTSQLYTLFIGTAVAATIILVLVLLFFKSAPPTPPSYAVAQQNEETVDFKASLMRLVNNRSYMLLLSAYGINVGVFYAISTLLNQIVLHYYPDASADAGRIGVAIVLAGMLGSVCCGIILDRFHKFKETTLTVYACCLLAMLTYTFTLSKGILVVYVISAILGFFMTGLLPVGFELAAELTYPEPEGTSSGLLNAASNLFGIAFTNAYSALFYQVGDVWANIVMCIALSVGVILLACTSSDLRRQAAHLDEKNTKH
ncbi:unnamed protein product [Callosobruchus maculatus]|uniref:Choline/ethanolamine transporter FLVCR1 n=1 Tax=Callosobruchus maculatus TaxID=64391 RepID=A0A653CPI5_CALMS|nr:unnamed protein product [Callosobruchus maculatus]